MHQHMHACVYVLFAVGGLHDHAHVEALGMSYFFLERTCPERAASCGVYPAHPTTLL